MRRGLALVDHGVCRHEWSETYGLCARYISEKFRNREVEFVEYANNVSFSRIIIYDLACTDVLE